MATKRPSASTCARRAPWPGNKSSSNTATRGAPSRVSTAAHGAPPDILEARIIAEEFARAQVSPGLGGQGIKMLIPTLLHFGSEAQRRQFIRPTLYGEMIWCQGYSEPGAGSDLASLRTRPCWKAITGAINGQKIWTSTAHLADWMFCLVRTEPDAPKHQGISFLLFPMSTPGIEVRPLTTMTATRIQRGVLHRCAGAA
jgi:alkylation response protein AidB-like acyl-CoA dehydrogenase